MAKARIGFVGTGGMGQMAHLRNYVILEDCEVVALAEARTDMGGKVGQRYDIPHVYADFREMFDAHELDGAVVSQRYRNHVALLPEIYPRVKHVFTEKPLALGVETGRRLADAADQAGCVHMVGYHKRSDIASEYALKLIQQWKASGEMGKLRYVRVLMPAGDWVAEGFRGLIGSTQKYPKLASEPNPPDLDEAAAKQYDAFVNYYIHQVNYMRFLLGEPYQVTYAEKSGVLMAVQSASGVAGTIEMTPYRTTVAWEESALVAFEKGYLTIRLPAPMAANRAGSVEIHQDPGDGAVPQRIEPTLPWVHAMRNQAANFVKVCRGEMAPPCAAREAVEDLKVAREYIRLRFGQ